MSLASEMGVTTAQWTVDAYAVQHATNHDRRNRQSVAIHLMSLCANLVYGVPGTELRVYLGTWTHREFAIPEPTPSSYPVTVREVSDATDEARPSAASDWAEETWKAWSPHHEQVSAWLRDVEAPFI
jgi:hypothetical protein